MKRILVLSTCALLLAGCSSPQGSSSGGWVSLFNGKDLTGWKANEKPGTFSVKNGEIVVHGERSHLFYDGPVMNHDFKNFEIKLDVMARAGSNSGVYIHTAYQDSDWPAKGYEIQVNNTHKDPKKTAGVYAIQDNYTAPAKDDEWFNMRIKVEGKRIQTFVNNKPISDYTEEPNQQRPKQYAGRLLSHGTFALQGHDPGSEVHFKNIQVKPLP